MKELDFKTKYKASVDEIKLPEDYRNQILQNLRAQEKAIKETPSKIGKSNKKLWLSLVAACLVLVLGVTLFSVLSPDYREVTLKVYTADTARALSGAKITFRDKKGELLKTPDGDTLTAITDTTGAAQVNLPKGEEYTAEISREGFITYTDTAKDSNYYISPKLSKNTYRAVLTWEKDVDLDAHLSLTKNGKTEKLFYFSSDITDGSGQVVAALDLDSEVALKPETITFNPQEDSVFRFTVCSYSALKSKDSISISEAKAKVTLYRGEKIVAVYEPSENANGNAWQVFEIENGQVKNSNYTYAVSSFSELK